ncbi:MAG: cupredoxin domain-containing protein [Bacteroidales bacterium]
MKTNLSFYLLLFATMMTFSLTSSCYKDESNYQKPVIGGKQGVNEVWITESGFNPTTLFVDVNTTVIWSNRDTRDHTVTADDGIAFGSGNIEPGFDFSHQFTLRGSFAYHCRYNFRLTGTIVVQ